MNPEELLKHWLSEMDAEEKMEMIKTLEYVAQGLRASLSSSGDTIPFQQRVQFSEAWRQRYR